MQRLATPRNPAPPFLKFMRAALGVLEIAPAKQEIGTPRSGFKVTYVDG